MSWNQALNWRDTNAHAGIPGAGDTAGIGDGFYVVLSGNSATVTGVALSDESTLTVDSSLESDTITTAAGTTFTVTGGNPPAVVQIDSSATFDGSVVDAGRMIAHASGINGTGVVFDGGTLIGPGDQDGNLSAGPNSSFTFEGPGGGNTFLTGATLGPDAGSVIFDDSVNMGGALFDGQMKIYLNGGTLGGSGSIQDWSQFNWTGGELALTGGVTVYSDFTSSGTGASS